ncbi:hypothetical protein Nepgr_012980 [Nepenthes gracilis]|uniref:FAD/NAD(P)-binding domain-containing protein n=1 Tax=Nepenthes gracilis TaxID=150966 RepID=A0AAD3SI84_NEPGR|nr:hypothetical protein Nepgr_012980 [Nepenthes gracilis]
MAAAGEEGWRQRLVVVGGGVAGALVAKSLQFDSDVTLIDSKEYFEIPWAELRTMVEPSFGKRTVINHEDYLNNVRIIASKAVNISSTDVYTEDGCQVPYDYLVIATGHLDHVPKTKPERLNQYQSEYEKIKAARSILIVGGGPTGVELAGEIAVDFPDKKVTLVHSGPRLMEFIGPNASNKTLDWLRAKGVEVKLERSVNLQSLSAGSGKYQTSAGEMIEADCHFLCIGKPLGSSWLKGTTLEANLDKNGRLMVDEHLRVKGHKNIFAIGDITDIQEIKQGFLAQQHASKAAKNLQILLAGGNESKMVTYKPFGSAVAIVSLGRKEGVAQFPFSITMIGRVPGMIKSKDLFVGKTRKQLGLDPNGV